MAHQGKTVLVTGGGGGLGRAIAENFVEVGANVVICDINKQLLADFDEKIVSKNAERVLAVECDITSEAALDDLFSKAESKFGVFDYVVNSAGIIDMFHSAGGLERPSWDRVIAINLTAPAFITKRAVNGMLKAKKKGSIVNIASIAAFRGGANGAAYTASKHGLVGLTKNTAAYYRTQGIRCNAIQAGGMKTNIGAALANGGFDMAGLEMCQKSMADMDELYVDIQKVAKLVAFLCSDDAEAINGAAVTADRGLTAP